MVVFPEKALILLFQTPLIFVKNLIISQLQKPSNAYFEVAKIDNCIGFPPLFSAIVINKKPLIFFSG